MSVIQSVQTKPIAFSIEGDDTLYYNADELKKYDPIYFRGTSRGIRKIIETKNIPVHSFIYALFAKKNNKWNKLIYPINTAKVLILKEWVDLNIFNHSTLISDASSTNIEREFAPDILLLKDNEKFKDVSGNIIDIETRGEKHVDKILFNLDDVSRGFGFNSYSTRTAITDKDTDYKIDLHYRRLSVLTSAGVTCTRQDGCQDDTSNSVVVKLVYFFTYDGLIMYLFRSNNPNKSSFQKWAISKIFVHQMGTIEDKKALSNELNASVEVMGVALKAQSGKVSCIYLIKIGSVSDLKTAYKIPDSISVDRNVYKYGFTTDFARRIKEHKKSYMSVTDNPLYVVKYAHIDNDFTSKAETDIKNTFNTFNLALDVDGNTELVTLNAVELKEIIVKYGDIATKYGGASSVIKAKIEEFDKTVEKMVNDHDKIIERMSNEIVMINMKNEYETTILKLVHASEISVLNRKCDSLSNRDEKLSLIIQIKDLEMEVIRKTT